MIQKERMISKPWGHEIIWAETKYYIGKFLTINPGCRLSRQYHKEKHETFRVLSGSMVLEIGEPGEKTFTSLCMEPGDTFDCSPYIVHRMCAGSEGCQVLEVSTGELEDVERLEDDYGRS